MSTSDNVDGHGYHEKDQHRKRHVAQDGYWRRTSRDIAIRIVNALRCRLQDVDDIKPPSRHDLPFCPLGRDLSDDLDHVALHIGRISELECSSMTFTVGRHPPSALGRQTLATGAIRCGVVACLAPV